jgi:hypothetical protein
VTKPEFRSPCGPKPEFLLAEHPPLDKPRGERASGEPLAARASLARAEDHGGVRAAHVRLQIIAYVARPLVKNGKALDPQGGPAPMLRGRARDCAGGSRGAGGPLFCGGRGGSWSSGRLHNPVLILKPVWITMAPTPDGCRGPGRRRATCSWDPAELIRGPAERIRSKPLVRVARTILRTQDEAELPLVSQTDAG